MVVSEDAVVVEVDPLLLVVAPIAEFKLLISKWHKRKCSYKQQSIHTLKSCGGCHCRYAANLAFDAIAVRG